MATNRMLILRPVPLLAALFALSCGSNPAAKPDVVPDVAEEITIADLAPVPDLEPDLGRPDVPDVQDADQDPGDVSDVDTGWTCGSELTCEWLKYPSNHALLHCLDMPTGVPLADWTFATQTLDQVRLKFVAEAGDSLGNLEFVVGTATSADGAPVPKHVWAELDIEPGTQAVLRPYVLPKNDPTPLDLGKKNLVLAPGQFYSISWTWTSAPLNAQSAYGPSLTFDAGTGYSWPTTHAYLVVDDPNANPPAVPPDQIRLNWDKGTTCGQAEQWITVWLPPDLTVTNVDCIDSANYGPRLTLTLPTPDIKLGMLYWLWTLDSISKPAWAE